MSAIAASVLTIHFVLLMFISLFGLHRLYTALRWWYYRRMSDPVPATRFDELPTVTVQIPLYNERFVAERIIHAVAAFNYPSDKLHIQIVDDSTDDTFEIVKRAVAHHKAAGINIDHVLRDNREGFKAGGLKAAMPQAKGEFIAIFDADFLPSANLLIDNIHHFSDAKLGMLQFRWGHLNRRNSLLTKTQALMIDAHFALDQFVRSHTGKLFNFNGTAGLWRKATIIDAGNWSADTLTEDLDLSYRAQLRGWRMAYLNNVCCPGELPADMNAFKIQQFRWAKGCTEVMTKLLKPVWQSKLPLSTKIESTFHLGNNFAYLAICLDTVVFLIPSLLIRHQTDMFNLWWVDAPLLMGSTGGHLFYVFTGQVALGLSKTRALLKIPALMLLSVQMILNNSRAAYEALRHHRSPFVRTPKSGELADKPATTNTVQRYLADVPKGALFELLLASVYGATLVWAAVNQHWGMLPFLILLAAGFMITAMHSLMAKRT